MKRLFIITFLTMNLLNLMGKDEKPDFRYPQTVASNAETQLSQALESNDGQRAIDALVRYGLAQSAISQENAPGILQKVADTKAVISEPDIKALLSVLEARIYEAYKQSTQWERRGRKNPTDYLPADIAEWDNAQFDAKIQSLLHEALSDEASLSDYDINGYKTIIEKDAPSHDYLPRLLDFLYNEAIDMTEDKTLRNQWFDQWQQANASAVAPTIYLKDRKRDDNLVFYRQYADYAESGLLLSHTEAGEETYPLYQAYLQKYPKSPYVAAIRNLIQRVERKEVILTYAFAVHPSQSIEVSAEARNVREAEALLFRIPDDKMKGHYWSISLKDEQPIATQPLAFPEHQPWEQVRSQASFAPLVPGYYAIVPRFKVGTAWQMEAFVYRDNVSYVSNYALFGLQSDENEVLLFAVDSKTGQPREGVKLELKKDDKTQVLTTESDGYASVEYNNYHVTVGNSDDHYSPELYLYYHTLPSKPLYRCNVFTDLAIYRPGEKLRYTAVAYTITSRERTLLSNLSLKATLRDASGDEVASQTLTTDAHGQIVGEFLIPTDRMNGTYSLYLEGEKISSHHSFEVAEYKMPTFFVNLDGTLDSYDPSQPVVLRGKAETYSGLPLSNQEVHILVRREEWSWWWRADDYCETMVEDTIRTAADGSFEYTVPADVINQEKVPADKPRWYYPRYRWLVNARLTDAGGESQEANASFSLGRIRELEWSGREDFLIKGDLTLPIVYRSTDKADQVVPLVWQLIDAADTTRLVAKGEFQSSAPVLPKSQLKSGRYLLKVSIVGDEDTPPLSRTILLYKETDSQCFATTPLWIPEDSRRLEKGKFHVLIGTNQPETHIWYVAQSRDKVVSRGWLHYKSGLHHFAMLMPEGMDEKLEVGFICVSDFRTYQESVTMYSPLKESINLSLASFRDRLIPNQDEEWTFTVKNQDSTATAACLLFELYNQALEDLADNIWRFNVPKPDGFVYTRFYHIFEGPLVSNSVSWQQHTRSDFRILEPQWHFYDRRFFTERSFIAYSNRMMMKSAAPMARNAVADDASIAEVEEAEGVVAAHGSYALQGRVAGVDDYSLLEPEAGGDVEDDDFSLLDAVQLRKGEIKVALWEPSISIGEDGICTYRFRAPESNGTWALQAIAFNDRVMTSGLQKRLVIQRPVMVQPKLPRFVRTGDDVTLQALVSNATDKALTATVLVEVFDPFTDKVLLSNTQSLTLSPKASSPVSLSLKVPASVAQLGFRVKAADADGNGDGEQQMIPVLPAVSPVVESVPFYLQPSDSSLEIRVPAYPADARLTLEVCANPVWYAVLALPTIADGNYVTATSLTHNLFALVLAEGLVKDNPQMGEAIRHWTENNAKDSVLQSQLEKNADLKITSLKASPWLPEAQQQTARMSRLSDLTDSLKNAATQSDILAKLQALQRPDGGLAWYPCEYLNSSYWATEILLQFVGELHAWGYAKESQPLNELCLKALAYYDSETVRRRDEMLRWQKDIDYADFAPFAYTRSLWMDHPLKGEAQRIANRAVKEVSNRWGEQSLVTRAYTALTLKNRGERLSDARRIVESLRQHALTKPSQGMYWDGIRWGGERWWDPVTLTSILLQTFQRVEPRQAEIDAIRQWLLLEKKTTDWGNSSLAADAVAALLSTGTKWTAEQNQIQVSLGGVPVVLPESDRYLGYSRCAVSSGSSDGAASALRVAKAGGAPAWGALYAQYEAPMDRISAARTDDLSIRKELLLYKADGSTVRPDSLKVGDKVQVRLVIHNERDLEYVSVVDERGACFEPLDQLSAPTSQDGLWLYRETKDSETHLFLDRLPKGTHVFSWDLNVTHAGRFAVGIATVQCQYSADQVAHSDAAKIDVIR